jgi:hypothetical protein
MSTAESAEAKAREVNPLVQRVEELLRRREAEAVPLLTEVVEFPAHAPPAADGVEPLALGADLERALLVRLAPLLDRRLAVLRAELETELRRAVREAVAAALGARAPNPPSES